MSAVFYWVPLENGRMAYCSVMGMSRKICAEDALIEMKQKLYNWGFDQNNLVSSLEKNRSKILEALNAICDYLAVWSECFIVGRWQRQLLDFIGTTSDVRNPVLLPRPCSSSQRPLKAIKLSVTSASPIIAAYARQIRASEKNFVEELNDCLDDQDENVNNPA